MAFNSKERHWATCEVEAHDKAGVKPFSSSINTSPPLDRSSSTTSPKPFVAARWSALNKIIITIKKGSSVWSYSYSQGMGTNYIQSNVAIGKIRQLQDLELIWPASKCKVPAKIKNLKPFDTLITINRRCACLSFKLIAWTPTWMKPQIKDKTKPKIVILWLDIQVKNKTRQNVKVQISTLVKILIFNFLSYQVEILIIILNINLRLTTRIGVVDRSTVNPLQ